MEIKTATRTGVKPLIGLYGKSGSGKTLSSLLVARGLVGPSGKIRLVDSESGRGSLFADIVPGGYEVIDLEPPFSPARYEEAIGMAEAGAAAVVVDSLTHEWSGEGGVLDWQESELDRMAGDNWGKREQCKMAAWIKPKLAHKMMIMRLLRCKCALICCLRGEEKTHIQKEVTGYTDVGMSINNPPKPIMGKAKVITDDFSTPLFDPRFIFEMLLNFETVIGANGEGGFVIPRKITHPSVRAILPQENQQIGIAFGEALAKWCAAPGGAPAAKPVAQSNFDALRQAAEGKAVELPDIEIKDVVSEKWKDKDVYKITFSNGLCCKTLDATIGKMAMSEIETGLLFMATYRPGTKVGSFELLTLEPMEGPIP